MTLRLNDFLDANIKNAFIKVWNLIGKGLTKTDDAYPIWKQIKDDMKDDSILQHEEACKALEPTFDAIDRALAMSLLLVIKKYDSPKNATAIAALAPTMQRVITNRKAPGQLWNGRSKVKQLLDMMKPNDVYRRLWKTQR